MIQFWLTSIELGPHFRLSQVQFCFVSHLCVLLQEKYSSPLHSLTFKMQSSEISHIVKTTLHMHYGWPWSTLAKRLQDKYVLSDQKVNLILLESLLTLLTLLVHFMFYLWVDITFVLHTWNCTHGITQGRRWVRCFEKEPSQKVSLELLLCNVTSSRILQWATPWQRSVGSLVPPFSKPTCNNIKISMQLKFVE